MHNEQLSGIYVSKFSELLDKGLIVPLAIFVVASLIIYSYLLPLLTNPETSNEVLILSKGNALVVDASLKSEPLPDAPLLTGSQQWSDVNLPVHWRHRFSGARVVWYRFDIKGSELKALAVDEPMLGVFIWRLNQTADVWFNGNKIGSGGSTNEPPLVRHWNSPLYFTLPAGLVRDDNQLLVRHFADHSWGSMQNVIVGPDTVLKPLYDTRYFVQHDIALGLFVFIAVAGLFGLAVWYYGRRESQYLWYAIASIGSSIYCVNQFARHIWIDADLWRWITNVATDVWACAILVFVLKSLNISSPRVEKAALYFVAAGVPLYFYASFFQVFDINIYFHIGSLIFIGYAAWLSFGHYIQTKQSISAFYGAMIVVGLIAGSHDTLMQAIVNNGWQGSGFRYHFNIVHFFAPLGFLLLGASLIKQYIYALNSADRLNAELETRVADASAALAENYQVMEQVLIKQSANEERERIYRDLHDDVGSKLLSLYYRLEDESNSTLAKSALEDLRDIVSRKSLENCSLSSAVQQWQVEAFGRARDAGVNLNWQFDAEENDPILEESQQAQLRRMLREVLSNAILHNPKIRNIGVHIRIRHGGLEINIENDGVSQPPDTWQPGRGISNLRLRARELEGEFSITDLGEGRVQLAWSVPISQSGKTLPHA
ncbi:MAG: signal transduction histidine kinase [Candidatus Azotimanducaceae bacterium]|jgi:signal transduction histidine kinase